MTAACFVGAGRVAVGSADGAIGLLRVDAGPEAELRPTAACHTGAVLAVLVTQRYRERSDTPAELLGSTALLVKGPDLAVEVLTLGADGVVMVHTGRHRLVRTVCCMQLLVRSVAPVADTLESTHLGLHVSELCIRAQCALSCHTVQDRPDSANNCFVCRKRTVAWPGRPPCI